MNAVPQRSAASVFGKANLLTSATAPFTAAGVIPALTGNLHSAWLPDGRHPA